MSIYSKKKNLIAINKSKNGFIAEKANYHHNIHLLKYKPYQCLPHFWASLIVFIAVK